MMIQSFSNKIRVPQIELARVAFAIVLFATTVNVFGQTNGGKNNPYSPSPGRKDQQEEQPPKLVKQGTGEVIFIMQSQNTPPRDERPTIAQRTFKIAKAADTLVAQPSEIYKIGVGDILFVNLKNSAKASGYYTVRRDGTIDYPLAGENVIVADQTTDNIEGMLESGITLFANPQIEVKVREYASHKITVSGLVDNAGEKNLQREAIPLYVIRAEAGVSLKATRVLITRALTLKVETYDLRDTNTANVLVYPGNSVEFTGEVASIGYYFIAGEVVSVGRKELTYGLTLYQAVIASGGSKGDPKKAIIRRKNEKGLFSNIEHNLRSIKDGRAADPALSPGDVIEIRN